MSAKKDQDCYKVVSLYFLIFYIVLIAGFQCHAFKIDQNKNQNCSIDKVQNCWENREGKYATTLSKIQVTAIFIILPTEICGEIFYTNLWRFVSRRHSGAHPDGHQHGSWKPTETPVTKLCISR